MVEVGEQGPCVLVVWVEEKDYDYVVHTVEQEVVLEAKLPSVQSDLLEDGYRPLELDCGEHCAERERA